MLRAFSFAMLSHVTRELLVKLPKTLLAARVKKTRLIIFHARASFYFIEILFVVIFLRSHKDELHRSNSSTDDNRRRRGAGQQVKGNLDMLFCFLAIVNKGI